MIKMFNRLCSSVLEALDNALPLLLVAIFYQMTILEIPLHEIVGMLGWILFVTFGVIMIV